MLYKVILIDLHKLQVDSWNYKSFHSYESLLKEYRDFSYDLSLKKNEIYKNTLLSIIKRKSSWSNTKLEISNVDESKISHISFERNKINKEIKKLLNSKTSESLERINEIKHLIEANKIIEFIYSEKWEEDPFNIEYILEMHKFIFKETKTKEAGKYKNKKNYVWIYDEGEHHDLEFVEPKFVKEKLLDLILFIKHSNIEPILKVIILHIQFVMIHPFIDGNGRIARLLCTKVFQEFEKIFLPIDEALLNFPIKNQHHLNKTTYLEQLNKVSIKGELNSFIEYMLEKYCLQMQENMELLVKIKNNFNKLKSILLNSDIKKKYYDEISSLILSNKVITTKIAKYYFNSTNDKRTIKTIFNKLIKIKLLKLIDTTGKEQLYKTLLDEK